MGTKRMERGIWQRSILNRMLSSRGCFNPVSELKGEAKKYSLRYQNSFYNLMERMINAGYIIIRCEGPRGGYYRSVFKAYPPINEEV